MYLEAVYWMSLASRPDRRRAFARNFPELRKLGVPIHEWQAYDGWAMSLSQTSDNSLNAGQIGSWLSHTSLWRHLHFSNQHAIVLEDDHLVVDGFAEKVIQVEPKEGILFLKDETNESSRAWAYWIAPLTAGELTRKLRTARAPIDWELDELHASGRVRREVLGTDLVMHDNKTIKSHMLGYAKLRALGIEIVDPA